MFHDFVLKYQIVIITSWFLMMYMLELPFIFNQAWQMTKTKRSRFFGNFSLGCINKLLLPMLTAPIIIAAVHLQFWHYSFSNISYFALVFLIFINVALLDLTSYFFHRISHKQKFLWRFHEIHHLDEALDATTGLRIHFGELFIATLFRVPIIILFSVPLESILIFELVVSMNGIFHHTNIKLPDILNKILSYIFVLPRWHAVHHHAIHQDTNSNYGFIFIWWDYLFGTLNHNHKKDNWVLGLKYSKDKSLMTLIFYPFTRKYLRNLA